MKRSALVAALLGPAIVLSAVAGHRKDGDGADRLIQCLLSPYRCSPCPKHPECPQRCQNDCCHQPLPQPKAVEPCEESDPCCCTRAQRVKAAHALGSFDACCVPQVVPALTHALMCDPAWQVRAAAARALRWSQPFHCDDAACDCQREEVIAALRIAEKNDPYWIVRSEAKDALGVLSVCNKCCYDEIIRQADVIAGKLKPIYKPGGENCHEVHAKWDELRVSLHETKRGSSASDVKPQAGKPGY
jgi:hypothetical protein